jgi:hypothetical protein
MFAIERKDQVSRVPAASSKQLLPIQWTTYCMRTSSSKAQSTGEAGYWDFPLPIEREDEKWAVQIECRVLT